MRSSAGEVERVDRKERNDKGNQHGTTNKVVHWGHVLKATWESDEVTEDGGGE